MGDTVLDKSSLNSNLTNICTLHVLNKDRSDTNGSVLNFNMGVYFLLNHFLAAFMSLIIIKLLRVNTL
jgi:hypothetical protein